MAKIELVPAKLLTLEELTSIYTIYNMTGQLFEDSPVAKLFGHIRALSKINNELILLQKEKDEN